MTATSTPTSPRVIRVGKRLVIVGTVHVDPSSVQEARNVIRTVKPSVVALELDAGRLNALAQQESGGEPKGRGSWAGPSAMLLGLLERVAGQLTGSMPGKEMLGAAEEATGLGARVALVDMPIDRTIGILRKIPLGEKIRLGLDSVASLVILGLGFGSGGGLGAGLQEVTGSSEELARNIDAFRQRYPNLSRLLIDNREDYMARNIENILIGSTGTVVAVVGLGHMSSLSKKLEGHPATYIGEQGGSYSTSTGWTMGT